MVEDMLTTTTGIIVIGSMSSDILSRKQLPDPEKVWGHTSCRQRILTNGDEMSRVANQWGHRVLSLMGFLCGIRQKQLFWGKDRLDELDPSDVKVQRGYVLSLSAYAQYQGQNVFAPTVADYLSRQLLHFAGIGFEPRPYSGTNSAWNLAVQRTVDRYSDDWGKPKK